MRRLLVILLLSSLSIRLSAQEKLISESFKETSLVEVFQLFKEKHDVKIAYAKRIVQDVNVTVEINNQSLENAFRLVLESTNLDFELLGAKAVIIKERNADEERFYSLSGVVTDAGTGERLPFAHVYTADLSRSTTTNEHGSFTLTGLKDSLSLNVSFIGYAPKSFRLSAEDANSRKTLSLQSNAAQLDEIEVTNEITDLMEVQSVGQINVDPSMVFSVPSTAERDPIRMLHLLPGVNSTNELSSGLEIQGGHSTQNVIEFDGFRIYHMDHFFGYFSAINPYAVKSQRLMKSGYNAKHGGGSSGYLEMVGKDGNQEEISGKLSVNQLSINSSLEIPVSKNTTLFASARRSVNDFLESSLFDRVFDEYRDQLFDEGEYKLPVAEFRYEPDFRFNDFNFKVSSNLSPRSQLSFSVYDSDDRMNFDELVRIRFPMDSAVIYNQLGFVEWGNLGASLKYTRYWNKSHFSEFYVSYSDYASDFEEVSAETYRKNRMPVGSSFNVDRQDNFIKDLSFDFKHEWHLKDWLVETGVQSTIYNTRIHSEYNDSTIVEKNQENLVQFVHYLNGSVDLSSKTTLSAGIRSNYLESKEGVRFEPRLSLSQDLGSSIRAHFATGIHRQFVNQILTQNTLQGSRDLWVISDDEVPDQRAFHASASLSKQMSRSFLEVGYFFRDFNGLLDYAYAQGARLTEYVNYDELFFKGSGYSRGAEFLYKFNSSKFDGLFGYTFKHIRYRFDDLNMGEWYPADHDQRHEMNALAMYKLGKLSLSGTWYYGSGTPYTEALPREPLPSPGGEGGGQAPPDVIFLVPTTSKNNDRFSAYSRFDLGASYKRNLGKVDVTLGANLFNVFNKTNFYDRQISFESQGPDTRPAISFSNLSLMERTLSFSVEVAF